MTDKTQDIDDNTDDLDAPSGDDKGDKGTVAAGDKGGEKQDQEEKQAPADDKVSAKGTIASGDDEDTDDDPKPAKRQAKAKKEEEPSEEETQSWREELAEYYAAGDKKLYKKELRRLERIRDQKAVYGLYRDLEAKFSEGGLVKIPGKDAKPEELAEFNKALGVPEKADEYYKDLTLENGAIVGEADKPFVQSFAEHMHQTGARPGEFEAALNWYYVQQEAQAAQMDEEDDAHRHGAEKELKEEFGPSYVRRTRALQSLFATAEGGTNSKNENSVFSRLMGGRTSDGRLIGNDPAIIRWLDGMRSEINPAASVVDDASADGKTIEGELKEIRALRQTNRREYYSDKVQKRELELINTLQKIQARA